MHGMSLRADGLSCTPHGDTIQLLNARLPALEGCGRELPLRCFALAAGLGKTRRVMAASIG